MDAQRLDAIEIKLAYMEDAVRTLNDIVVEQQKTLAAQQEEIVLLKRKVSELMELQDGDVPDRRPPHY